MHKFFPCATYILSSEHRGATVGIACRRRAQELPDGLVAQRDIGLATDIRKPLLQHARCREITAGGYCLVTHGCLFRTTICLDLHTQNFKGSNQPLNPRPALKWWPGSAGSQGMTTSLSRPGEGVPMGCAAARGVHSQFPAPSDGCTLSKLTHLWLITPRLRPGLSQTCFLLHHFSPNCLKVRAARRPITPLQPQTMTPSSVGRHRKGSAHRFSSSIAQQSSIGS
jgi:hypothetical protein